MRLFGAPDLSTCSLAYLFDIADELHRRGGPNAAMKPVYIQSPMDIVALIWEKEDLFCAMVETPDTVKAVAEKVRTLLVSFFDEARYRYLRCSRGACVLGSGAFSGSVPPAFFAASISLASSARDTVLTCESTNKALISSPGR